MKFRKLLNIISIEIGEQAAVCSFKIALQLTCNESEYSHRIVWKHTVRRGESGINPTVSTGPRAMNWAYYIRSVCRNRSLQYQSNQRQQLSSLIKSESDITVNFSNQNIPSSRHYQTEIPKSDWDPRLTKQFTEAAVKFRKLLNIISIEIGEQGGCSLQLQWGIRLLNNFWTTFEIR